MCPSQMPFLHFLHLFHNKIDGKNPLTCPNLQKENYSIYVVYAFSSSLISSFQSNGDQWDSSTKGKILTQRVDETVTYSTDIEASLISCLCLHGLGTGFGSPSSLMNNYKVTSSLLSKWCNFLFHFSFIYFIMKKELSEWMSNYPVLPLGSLWK